MDNSQRWRSREMFLAWATAVGLMAIGFALDFDADQRHQITRAPELSALSAKAAFFTSVKASIVELVVLYAILRPWTFTARTWYRALVAFVLFVPYGVLILAVGPGGKLSFVAHGLWVLAILLALSTTTLISFSSRTPRENPN